VGWGRLAGAATCHRTSGELLLELIKHRKIVHHNVGVVWIAPPEILMIALGGVEHRGAAEQLAVGNPGWIERDLDRLRMAVAAVPPAYPETIFVTPLTWLKTASTLEKQPPESMAV
jgi:hypothetical protein